MDFSACYNLNHSNIDWVAILALGIAIISLGIGVYFSRKTLRLTVEHNKKSVEPLLTTAYSALQKSDIPNCCVEMLTLTNCGFGPAIIKFINLIWKNKTYTNMSDLYNEFMNYEPRYVSECSTAQITCNNAIIGSNESVILFNFFFAKTVPIQVDYFYAINFHKLAKEVSLNIEFETIYREVRYFEIKSLTD